jgi:hypothetical protein
MLAVLRPVLAVLRLAGRRTLLNANDTCLESTGDPAAALPHAENAALERGGVQVDARQ